MIRNFIFFIASSSECQNELFDEDVKECDQNSVENSALNEGTKCQNCLTRYKTSMFQMPLISIAFALTINSIS